jgi:hypothetical protein
MCDQMLAACVGRTPIEMIRAIRRSAPSKAKQNHLTIANGEVAEASASC